MDIQTIEAFVRVSETGSFSRAAENLHITQPAVSKRVSALEQELSTKLFDRIGKQVQLTEAGRAFLPGCYRILKEIEDSRRIVSNLSGHIGGTLSIATSHHIGLHRLPPVLKNFVSLYPEVELDIHFMDSEEACAAVLKGQLELAIATLPEKADRALNCEIIWNDPLVFILAADHLQARQINRVTDLIDIPAILPSQNTYTRALLDKHLGSLAAELRIAMESNFLETIKMMVSIGLGWSLLPASMLSADVHRLAIESPAISRQLGLVSHQERTLSNAAVRLVELLMSQKPRSEK